MQVSQFSNMPEMYPQLVDKSNEIGFDMPSDIGVGRLLRTLVRSKPNGRFLELGTGMGLSLSWMVAGMGTSGTMVSIDNDTKLIEIVKAYFEAYTNVQFICEDGGHWIETYQGPAFDLVFADAWPGKYSHLDQTLAHIKQGGYYVIDDMLEQPNWPSGHDEKAAALLQHLNQREDIDLAEMNWSTGVVIAVKK